jgi:hypothetical protein
MNPEKIFIVCGTQPEVSIYRIGFVTVGEREGWPKTFFHFKNQPLPIESSTMP